MGTYEALQTKQQKKSLIKEHKVKTALEKVIKFILN